MYLRLGLAAERHWRQICVERSPVPWLFNRRSTGVLVHTAQGADRAAHLLLAGNANIASWLTLAAATAHADLAVYVGATAPLRANWRIQLIPSRASLCCAIQLRN